MKAQFSNEKSVMQNSKHQRKITCYHMCFAIINMHNYVVCVCVSVSSLLSHALSHLKCSLSFAYVHEQSPPYTQASATKQTTGYRTMCVQSIHYTIVLKPGLLDRNLERLHEYDNL